ncbi:hypothetical protein CRENBAI_006895, partial [Crenichthys baileyi]
MVAIRQRVIQHEAMFRGLGYEHRLAQWRFLHGWHPGQVPTSAAKHTHYYFASLHGCHPEKQSQCPTPVPSPQFATPFHPPAKNMSTRM